MVNNKSSKKVTILVIIALVLAITAIAMKVMDSNQVPTSYNGPKGDNGGNVGIVVNPPIVEDKLAQTETGEING